MDANAPATKLDIDNLRLEFNREVGRTIAALRNHANAQSLRTQSVESKEGGLAARVAILEEQLLDLQIRRAQLELANALQRTQPTRN